MSQFSEYMFSLWGYWLAGAIVAATGGIMVWGSRRAEPGSRKVLRWIGFPTIGCGVILLAVPFTAVAGGLLMLFGVVTVCENISGC